MVMICVLCMLWVMLEIRMRREIKVPKPQSSNILVLKLHVKFSPIKK